MLCIYPSETALSITAITILCAFGLNMGKASLQKKKAGLTSATLRGTLYPTLMQKGVLYTVLC